MNILHVVRTPLTISIFLMPFLQAQQKQGHNVAVACDADEDTTAIEARGIAVHKYSLKRSLSLLNLCGAFRSLREILNQSQFDLIIVHMPIAGAVTRLAARLSCCRAKVIYVSHGLPCGPKQSKLRWLMWFITEWILGRITDALFVMNNYDYNLAVKTRMLRNRNCVRKIPGMGVDLTKFSLSSEPCRDFLRKLGIKSKKVVLFVARLVGEKGVFEFLEAARLLANRDYAFVLLGDGPLETSVSQFISDNNLHESVFLLGWRDDVDEFMKRCDLFVLPTYYFEGLPVTILEAMACGKPVIATRHRGCEDEVVDGETGYLIEIKNPKELAEKIDLLLNDEALCVMMGKRGRERVENCFSLEHAVKAFSDEVLAVSRCW